MLFGHQLSKAVRPALAAVVETGVRTYLGSMASVITQAPLPTSFDRGVSNFTFLMLEFMAVMVPAVFLINGFSKHRWGEAFLFAPSRWRSVLRRRCS